MSCSWHDVFLRANSILSAKEVSAADVCRAGLSKSEERLNEGEQA